MADLAVHGRRMLADTAGEHERIPAGQRGGRSGDGHGDTAGEHPQREIGGRVVVAGGKQVADVVQSVGDAGQPGAPVEQGADGVDGGVGRLEQQQGISGSRSPLRVADMTPLVGVSDMLLCTERPVLTAVTEQPLPRWAMVAPPRSGRASTIDCTDRPWKP